MYVKRSIESIILELNRQYPIITITGPRQSGKTTLVKKIFSNKPYYSLEDPDTRQMIMSDPRGFLNEHEDGAILDEAQRYADFFSYLQGHVDKIKKNGLFVLTGSNQFLLINSVTQSLAGRTALLKLLPFSINELNSFKKKQSIDEFLYKGFYPGIYSNKRNPTIAYRNYYETYIERDIRQLINVKDLSQFQRFMRLCAGRTGQLFNASHLSGEVGVSVPTIQSWISVLQASYIVFLLEPYYENIRKRLTKTPKLYFYDTGFASYLLGIENQKQMSRDPLRGNVFENMVILEYIKMRYNNGYDHNAYFYRDSHHNEVDLIIKSRNEFEIVEIKSSQTFNPEFLKGINNFKSVFGSRVKKSFIVYNGNQEKNGKEFHLLNYKHFSNQMSEI